MHKTSTATLLIAGFLLLGSTSASAAQSRIASIHNVDKLFFRSVEEATNYFNKAEVPIEVLGLKTFKEENLVLAAYPYSGKDTIDIYYFVKNGPNWNLKMLYFHLRPKYRRPRVEETQDYIVLYDKDDELLRIKVDRTLNKLER